MNIGDKITMIHGDIADYEKVQRTVNQFSVDTCFHLAAQAIVQFANHSPLSTFDSNIKGTWNILEACRNSKNIQRVVVASSDKAYGSQNKLPYKEDSPLLGLYPYDASKACADILARTYHNTYGLHVAVTRNANTFGGGDLNFSRLIPDAIRCAIKRREFIVRSDGKYKRDYMYVKDAISGYLVLAENLHKKDVQGQAFNFGTEKPVTVLELVEKISKLTNNKIKPKIIGKAGNEIKNQYLSIEKVKSYFGWTPKYTLERGLSETIEWYRNYFK
jgi:CDP-glucose 4,6-dehydratase